MDMRRTVRTSSFCGCEVSLPPVQPTRLIKSFSKACKLCVCTMNVKVRIRVTKTTVGVTRP